MQDTSNSKVVSKKELAEKYPEEGKKTPAPQVIQAIVRDGEGWSLVELSIPHDFPRKKLHGPDYKRVCLLRLLSEMR